MSRGENKIERLDLKDQLRRSLEEARILMPGVQALFGFQLIVVFNPTFHQELTKSEEWVHLVAIALTVLAAALVMAPAAFHRQSAPETVSTRLVELCSRLLATAMYPLMLALVLDFYLLCKIVVDNRTIAVVFAVGLFTIFLVAWVIAPALMRRWLNETKAPEA